MQALIIMFNNKSNTYLKQNNNSLDRFETIMFNKDGNNLIKADKLIYIDDERTLLKGQSSLKNDNYEFILCAGDDVSDENMFMNLPEKSFSVKIGEKNSAANYFISNSNEFICLLKKIIEIEK